MTSTVLILGASGKIGAHAATAFKTAGWHVKIYDRKAGDITAAAIGVDVIVNGLNPPNYHNWTKLIPEITAQVIDAAKASGATVIIPGNVYNFGENSGTWDENTPQVATTRKGQTRIEMEKSYRDSGVQTIILRAGNFIDPNHNGDVMDLVFLPKIANGKIVSPGVPDMMQAYCYLPDWAKAAVMLTEKRAELHWFEDVPFPGHAFTTNDLCVMLQDIMKRPIKLVKFPWFVMTLTAPFWELARELNEMRYLWNTSHQLSATKFNRLLPDFQTTPVREVITAALPGDVYPNQTVPGRVGVSLA